MHCATNRTALCYVHVMCPQGEKKMTSTIEDIAKLPKLLLRNANISLVFLKVYITTLP